LFRGEERERERERGAKVRLEFPHLARRTAVLMFALVALVALQF
jgi:hypothetical protein